VYSLGVLIYELLVGVQPFDVHELRSSGFDEMRRKIREQDPPRPSTRVSTSGKTSPEIAERLRTDAPTLARWLRGDLDWIVMKALEKDRNRRYGSPAELAIDIERHLNDQPVLASPPSATYRMGKFVRRHRGPVIAGGLIVTTLIVGFTVATIGMVRARRAERLANSQVDLLIGLFDSLDPMRETVDSGIEGSGRSTAEDLLSGAQERIDTELGDEPLVRAQLNATLGRIYMNLGNHEKAITAWQEAHEIRLEELGPDHPDVLTSTLSLGTIHDVMGNYQSALDYFRLAAEMRMRILGPNHPDTAESLNSLAFGLWRNGDYDEAAPLFERALEIRVKTFGPDHAVVGDTLYMQAVCLRDAGEYDRARDGFERALAIREAVFGPDHTAVAWVVLNYGFLFAQLGETDDARANFERALAIQEETFGPDNFMVIAPLNGLATLDLESGDLELARQRATRAVRLQELNHGTDHHFVASGLDVLARIEHRAGNNQLARNHLERGLRLREAAVGAEHPQVATSLFWLARLNFADGRYESATDLYERRQAILEAAYGADHRDAILNRISIAWANARSGRLDIAAQLYRDNGRAAADLLENDRAGSDLYNLGCLATLLGQHEDALIWLRRSLEYGVDPALFSEDNDLEALRGDPSFEALVSAPPTRSPTAG
jgi:tetratricopeptide (TPR) repeat protein